MKVYIVKIEFQGITDTLEAFESEQDAINLFAESLKDAVPEIGHKIRHDDLDFWYVHWEKLDELLADSDYSGSQLYHCDLVKKTELRQVKIITLGESKTDPSWLVLRWPDGREIVVHYDGKTAVRRA